MCAYFESDEAFDLFDIPDEQSSLSPLSRCRRLRTGVKSRSQWTHDVPSPPSVTLLRYSPAHRSSPAWTQEERPLINPQHNVGNHDLHRPGSTLSSRQHGTIVRASLFGSRRGVVEVPSSAKKLLTFNYDRRYNSTWAPTPTRRIDGVVRKYPRTRPEPRFSPKFGSSRPFIGYERVPSIALDGHNAIVEIFQPTSKKAKPEKTIRLPVDESQKDGG